MNRYLDVAPEVQEAIKAGKPVVALESTIISHGMPYPQNVETALHVEKIIREHGAVPATIAIIGGRLKAGLTAEEIDYLGKTGAGVTKASRRDLPILVAEKRDGATTVTTTMMIAAMAGIEVFATGGIGGVHRGAETTMDISADLEELAQTPVMVVCAGAKSILDLGLTLGIWRPTACPSSAIRPRSCPRSTPASPASAWTTGWTPLPSWPRRSTSSASWDCGGGMLVTNPIPEEYSMDADVINKAIDEAVEEAKEQGIHGKATTPFLLAKIKDITGGDSLAANIQLVYNNAKLAADTACELAKLRKCRLTVAALLSDPAGLLAVYLAVINLATFAVYGADKRRARRGKWRVPEKTLFLLPLLGGSVGALLGMRMFHHKTKHWYFVWGIPAILLAQLALAVWLLTK